MLEKKTLTNKRLISLLMDHRKIELITISKDKIICQCYKSFYPSDLKPLIDATGQKPTLTTSEGVNYIVFKRFG